jgi:hypothetical protein
MNTYSKGNHCSLMMPYAERLDRIETRGNLHSLNQAGEVPIALT